MVLCTMIIIIGITLTSTDGARRIPGPAEHEQLLLRRLLTNYDKDARGVVNPQEPVNVTLSFVLFRIHGLDERRQVLTITGLIIVDWYDGRLVWDPSDYNNLEDIVVHPERIWLPELALMNGAEEQAPDFSRIRTLLSHDGRVHWEPGGIFTTTCDIDIRYFPFDEQVCSIKIGAWAYFSARMNVTVAENTSTIQMHDYRLNGEWEIMETNAESKVIVLPCTGCEHIQYPYVEFTLRLQRRYTFYIMNIILPCALLSLLVMVVFCLPPDAGEKVSLGISVLLAFTVFLLMVAENVPRTSLHVPVIVIYLTCTMFLGTISVCLTVLVLNLHFRDSEQEVPDWVRILCFKYLAHILRIDGRKPNTFARIEQRLDAESHADTSLSNGLRKISSTYLPLSPTAMKGQLSNGHGPSSLRASKLPFKDKKRKFASRVVRNFGSSNESSRSNSCDGDDSRSGYTWNSYEWREVAHILDRLFFIVVFILMTGSTMIIVFVPAYRQSYSASMFENNKNNV